jgi:hypothetical protein
MRFVLQNPTARINDLIHGNCEVRSDRERLRRRNVGLIRQQLLTQWLHAPTDYDNPLSILQQEK